MASDFNKTGATRTIIIKPGEKYILPPGSVVNSVVLNGAIDVTSSCNDLPAPTLYKCGFFYLLLDVDSNSGHSMDETTTTYLSLRVQDKIYNIGRKVVASGDNPGILTAPSILNTHITDSALFSFTAIGKTVLAKRQGIWVYFKTPQNIFNDVELQVNNNGSIQYYKGNEGECGSYPFGTVTPDNVADAKTIILG